MEQIEIKDKIDSYLLEQNLQVVLRHSQNCMEMRKMTVSLVGIFMTAVVGMKEMRKLLQQSFWWSLIGIAIVVVFWILELYNYCQQERFRAKVNKLMREIGARNGYKIPQEKFEKYALPLYREDSKKIKRALRGFNNTYAFYLAIIAFIIIGCICVKFMS